MVRATHFLPLSVELGSDENVAAAIQQAYRHFGRIDVAVNNAGYGIGGSMEELTDKETRDSFDINVFATINVIRHVLSIMRTQQSRHIINISSIAGIAPSMVWSVYGAVKHAVIGLTEVLADDVRPFGIKVTLIAPGAFRTNFNNSDSLVLSQQKIDAYAGIRSSQERFITTSDTRVGDPSKAAKSDDGTVDHLGSRFGRSARNCLLGPDELSQLYNSSLRNRGGSSHW